MAIGVRENQPFCVSVRLVNASHAEWSLRDKECDKTIIDWTPLNVQNIEGSDIDITIHADNNKLNGSGRSREGRIFRVRANRGLANEMEENYEYFVYKE